MWLINSLSKAGYETGNRNSEKRKSEQDKPEIGNVGFPSGLGNALKSKGELIKLIGIKQRKAINKIEVWKRFGGY